MTAMPDSPGLRDVMELQEAQARVVSTVKTVPPDREVLRVPQDGVETQEPMELPDSVEPREMLDLVVCRETKGDPVPVALELKETLVCLVDLNASRERPVPRELPEPREPQDETGFPEERETEERQDGVEPRETPARTVKQGETELTVFPAVTVGQEARETAAWMAPRETPAQLASEAPRDLEVLLVFQETKQRLLQEKMEPQETTDEQEAPACQELKETPESPARTESPAAPVSRVTKERPALLGHQDTAPREPRETEGDLELQDGRENKGF